MPPTSVYSRANVRVCVCARAATFYSLDKPLGPNLRWGLHPPRPVTGHINLARGRKKKRRRQKAHSCAQLRRLFLSPTSTWENVAGRLPVYSMRCRREEQIWLKRLWEQWTQHTVRGAFRPTILAIENSGNSACLAVFEKIQPPAEIGFSQTQPGTQFPCRVFNGEDSWPKGTPDRTNMNNDKRQAPGPSS